MFIVLVPIFTSSYSWITTCRNSITQLTQDNFASIAICESSSYHVASKMLSFKIFVIPLNMYADHEQLDIDEDKVDSHICY